MSASPTGCHSSAGERTEGAGRTLITGASSGIGLALARRFAAGGDNLVLIARREEKLDAVADALRRRHSIEATVLACDVANPGAPRWIEDRLDAHSFGIDTLVNCAGFGTHGRFASADLRRELEMLTVNVAALTELTGRLLPDMVARGRGRILNVASTAAFQPTPLMATYGATKAYVLSFSEALAEELRDSGVTVTALCPGVVDTGFQARAGVETMRLVHWGSMSADRVAELAYRDTLRGRPLSVPGWGNRLLAVASRLAPRGVRRRLARWSMELDR